MGSTLTVRSPSCSTPGLERTFVVTTDIRKLPVSNKTRTQDFQPPCEVNQNGTGTVLP